MAGPYGDVTIGRMTLGEDTFDLDIGSDGSLAVSVAVADVPDGNWLAQDPVERRMNDLLGLDGQLVPVTFTYRRFLDGFYRVVGVALSHGTYPRYFVGDPTPRQVVATAKVTLARVGATNTIEIESRLAGSATRSNDHGAVGTRWHAPAGGHSGYLADAVLRPWVRRSSDGPIVCYRAIPDRTYPRWTSTPEGFLSGRCRFFDADGHEVTGTAVALPLSTHTDGLVPDPALYPAETLYPHDDAYTVPPWLLTNGIIRVAPTTGADDGVFTVSTYSGGGWGPPLAWDVRTGDGSIGPISGISLLHNTLDTVVLRLFRDTYPGSVTIDVQVRRGAPFAELHIDTPGAGVLTVRRGTADPGAAAAGYMTAANPDAGGNRWIVGSPTATIANTVGGGIYHTRVDTLDAFVGTILGGDGAARGDTAPEVFSQYLGTPAEHMVGSRR